jgi:hypothetical protein
MGINEGLYNDINASKAGLSAKVDKETGKGLSTNDFTDGYKAILDDLDAPTSRVTAITTTELTTDNLIVCNSATAITVNMLSFTGSNRIREISNINTGAVTVEGNSTDTINGELNQVIYQWESIVIKDYASGKGLII